MPQEPGGGGGTGNTGEVIPDRPALEGGETGTIGSNGPGTIIRPPGEIPSNQSGNEGGVTGSNGPGTIIRPPGEMPSNEQEIGRAHV